MFLAWPSMHRGSGAASLNAITFYIILAFVTAHNWYVRTFLTKCLPKKASLWLLSVLSALAIGAGFGTLWSWIWKEPVGQWSWSPYPNQESNKLKCDKPSKNYKCQVYKDGVKVGSL